MKFVRPLLTIFLIGGASLAVAQEPTPVGHPEQLGFSASRLQRLTQAYQGYVDRGELPGAVLLIAVGDKIAYLQAAYDFYLRAFALVAPSNRQAPDALRLLEHQSCTIRTTAPRLPSCGVLFCAGKRRSQ
jgi:hypothetical protein